MEFASTICADHQAPHDYRMQPRQWYGAVLCIMVVDQWWRWWQCDVRDWNIWRRDRLRAKIFHVIRNWYVTHWTAIQTANLGLESWYHSQMNSYWFSWMKIMAEWMIVAGHHILWASSCMGSACGHERWYYGAISMFVCTYLYRLPVDEVLGRAPRHKRIGIQGEHGYEYELRQTLNLAEVRIGSQQCRGITKQWCE